MTGPPTAATGMVERESQRRPSVALPVNHHCSIADLDGIGILVEGPSGAGKTSLVLGLVDAARGRGIDAMLVCDDQALLAVGDGQLVASAPATIRGKAELYGHGIIALDARASTQVRLVARLVADARIERMPAVRHVHEIAGIELPAPVRAIDLPARHETQGIRILLALHEEFSAS